MLLQKGTLWQRLTATTEGALRCGALVPVPTGSVFIEDNGARFFVRVLSGLRRKDEARKKQDAEVKAGKAVNPFLPPEKELTVCDVTDTHVAVLNKFNVVDHHLLIVTRHFEDQDTLLTPGDFEALWRCMAEYRGLGFYNGGREAGASQQHKHLQLVPLPMAPEGPAAPIEPLLAAADGEKKPCTVPGFPFLHAFVRLEKDLWKAPVEAAKKSFFLYSEMLSGLGMDLPSASGLGQQSGPYCFLTTREWMLLVPRTKEFFEDISFNSLAFAGSFFVRNEAQLARLQKYGPLNALRQTARDRDNGKPGNEEDRK